jgi:hypothetical protein
VGNGYSCRKTRRDGQKCRAMAIAGSQFCFFHDPAAAGARKTAQKKGGQANGLAVLSADEPDVPLNSCKDVSAFLAATINQVRKGLIAPKVATTVGYLASLLVKTFESDLEDRLGRLEQVVVKRGSDEALLDPDADEVAASEN